MGKSLEHIGKGEYFLNRTPIAYALRSTIDKWDLIKLENFCKAKDTVNRAKQQPTDWEKILTNPKSKERANSQYIQRTPEVRLQRTK